MTMEEVLALAQTIARQQLQIRHLEAEIAKLTAEKADATQ
jgi:hypothetical protein